MKLINAVAILAISASAVISSSSAFSMVAPSAIAAVTATKRCTNYPTAASRISESLPLSGGSGRWKGGGVKSHMSASSATASAARCDESADSDSTKQTISSAAFNLIKGAVGSGVLSLPAGVAAFGDVPKAVVPATSLIFILGAISAYSFHILGRLTAAASSESDDRGSKSPQIASIGDIWDREVGSSTSWLVSLAVMLTCFGISLSYSIILGDTFKSLAETAGLSGAWTTRRFNVAAIALFGVYPLSCLKSLAAIAPVSKVGVVGILATCVVMTMRALPGGAYSATAAAATSYLPSLPADCLPSFGVGIRGVRSLLVLSSMAATSFLVHMSSPEFYNTLRTPSLARFGTLSAVGFGGTAAISAYMMIVGFLTFGGACKGMILNNYSTLDAGATLCRLLMGVSLLGSYAFIGQAMKKAWYQIFNKEQEITNTIHYRTTRLLVGTLTALALLVEDAGFIVSVTGAVLGSALIYVTPSYLFLRSTKRRVDDGSLRWTKALRIERWWNRFLIVLGVFLGLSGACMSVLNSFFRDLL